MNGRPNLTCAVCGQPYYCCPDSLSVKSFTPWKRITDTLDHYRIFLIIQDYTNGTISRDEAAAKLSACDLAHKAAFREDIRTAIDTILTCPFCE